MVSLSQSLDVTDSFLHFLHSSSPALVISLFQQMCQLKYFCLKISYHLFPLKFLILSVDFFYWFLHFINVNMIMFRCYSQGDEKILDCFENLLELLFPSIDNNECLYFFTMPGDMWELESRYENELACLSNKQKLDLINWVGVFGSEFMLVCISTRDTFIMVTINLKYRKPVIWPQTWRKISLTLAITMDRGHMYQVH